MAKLLRYCLKAAACKNQQSADKSDFTDFFIFCPEKPFGELLSKIAIKLSKGFLFLRNLAITIVTQQKASNANFSYNVFQTRNVYWGFAKSFDAGTVY